METLKKELEIREFIRTAVEKEAWARLHGEWFGERNKDLAQASLDAVESEYEIAKARYENAKVDKELDDICDNLIKAVKGFKKALRGEL